MRNTPYIIGGLLFLLVVFFFIQSPERFLYPSRASQERARLFFTPIEVNAHVGDSIPISVYMQTNPGTPISETRISLHYDPQSLVVEPIQNNQPEQACIANHYFMQQFSDYQNDNSTGIVSLTRSSANEERDGLFCWGTIYFRALRDGITDVSLPINLEDTVVISGSHGALVPMVEKREVVHITVN